MSLTQRLVALGRFRAGGQPCVTLVVGACHPAFARPRRLAPRSKPHCELRTCAHKAVCVLVLVRQPEQTHPRLADVERGRLRGGPRAESSPDCLLYVPHTENGSQSYSLLIKK